MEQRTSFYNRTKDQFASYGEVVNRASLQFLVGWQYAAAEIIFEFQRRKQLKNEQKVPSAALREEPTPASNHISDTQLIFSSE